MIKTLLLIAAIITASLIGFAYLIYAMTDKRCVHYEIDINGETCIAYEGDQLITLLKESAK